MKKDSYYFPHDYNSRNDEKILYIRSKYGIEGYGLYWMFIETMHEQEDGKLTCSLINGLSLNYNVDISLLNDFYNDAINIGLFVTDNYKFWSERVIRNKQEFKEKKEKKSIAGKIGMQQRWNKNNSVITDNNNVITKNNKGKEIKGKEIKGNKENKYPTLDEVIEYFTTNGYTSEIATKAFNYYSVANWKDSNGKQVKNWKQKMQSVWFKEENKVQQKMPSYRNADGSLKIIL